MVKVMWMCDRAYYLLLPVVVQSTVPDFDGNLKLVEELHDENKNVLHTHVKAADCFVLDEELLHATMLVQRDMIAPGLAKLKELTDHAIPAATTLDLLDGAYPQ